MWSGCVPKVNHNLVQVFTQICSLLGEIVRPMLAIGASSPAVESYKGPASRWASRLGSSRLKPDGCDYRQSTVPPNSDCPERSKKQRPRPRRPRPRNNRGLAKFCDTKKINSCAVRLKLLLPPWQERHARCKENGSSTCGITLLMNRLAPANT